MAQRSSNPGNPKFRYFKFGLGSILGRALFVLFLVFAVYNPSGTSLFHWVCDDFATYWMLQIPAAVLLTIFYFLVLRATVLMLRIGGMALITAILGCIVWALSDVGVIELRDRVELELAVMLVMAGLLTAGVSSMHVFTRLTGQVNLDDLTRDGGA